tara:strand:+ start:9129 stop:9536 length:408 start_codon:yes stop_codon:yes gene_type:complete
MAKETLRDWFAKNDGKGWVDCKTGKPCGRKKGEKRAYPACRPTMAQCTSAAKRKTGPKRINWQKKSTGGEMKKAKRDYDGDGKIESSKNEYFGSRDKAIKSAMSKQNRVKMKNGGFIAKGCGQVMNDRRKVTSIS